MGSQASKVLEKTKDKKKKTAPHPMDSPASHGNYDWIAEQTPMTAAGPRRKSFTDYFTKRRPSRLSDSDYREFDRWQRQHYLLKSARKANTWASFDDTGPVIVDVGTGNGIWALEMANQYPTAQVFGLDQLYLDQHRGGPDNLRFCHCDVVNEPWPISDVDL